MLTNRHTLIAVLVVAATGCAHGVDPLGPESDGVSLGGTSGIGNTSGGDSNGGGDFGSGGSGGSVTVPSGGGTSPGGGASGATSSGGTSPGGASSNGGASGAGTKDAGEVVVVPIPPGDIVAQYFTMPSNNDTAINPHLEIVNKGTKDVPLAQLTMRYWYTADGTATGTGSQVAELNYADITRLTGNRTSVVLTTGPLTPPQKGADAYVEVGFKGPDSIGPGQQTVDKTPMTSTNQIELRVHWAGYGTHYTETNDYSYDAKPTSFAISTKVTIYQAGKLIWGTEPDGTMPTMSADPSDAGSLPSDAGTD